MSLEYFNEFKKDVINEFSSGYISPYFGVGVYLDEPWENLYHEVNAYTALGSNTLRYHPMKNLYGNYFINGRLSYTFNLAYGFEQPEAQEKFDLLISDLCDLNNKIYSITGETLFLDDIFYNFQSCLDLPSDIISLADMANRLSYFENFSSSAEFLNQAEKENFSMLVEIAKKIAMARYFAIKSMPVYEVENFRDARILEAKMILEDARMLSDTNISYFENAPYNPKYDFFGKRGENGPKFTLTGNETDEERMAYYAGVYKYYKEQMKNASVEDIRKYMLECVLEPKYVEEFESEYQKRNGRTNNVGFQEVQEKSTMENSYTIPSENTESTELTELSLSALDIIDKIPSCNLFDLKHIQEIINNKIKTFTSGEEKSVQK